MPEPNTRRVALILVLPPVLLIAVSTIFAMGASAFGGPDVGDPAEVIQRHILLILALNHSLLALVLWRFLKADGLGLEYLGWNPEKHRRNPWVEVGVGLAFGVALAVVLDAYVGPLLRGDPVGLGGMLGRTSTVGANTLLSLAVSVGFGGVVEESLYRGYGQRALTGRLGPAAAIVVTSLAFGPLHFGLGFNSVIRAILYGVGVGSLMRWRGSLLASGVAHGTTNALTVLLFTT